jgi:FtsP/CotA-like multicopper oxidase with cupredoxin domain
MTAPERSVSRRSLLRAGAAGAIGLSGIAIAGASARDVAGADASPSPRPHGPDDAHAHAGNVMVGDVDHASNGFDPTAILTDFDPGRTSQLPDGRTLREWDLAAVDREIEVVPGVRFPAWTYNGRVPGPTLRATEGDLLRVHFVNGSTMPHSLHFHGWHPASMDGIEPIPVGGRFTYEFDAEPFGLHLYHCHVEPLKRHIHRGLYGGFVIDPVGGREPARELFMCMNGFDTNLDASNEVYAVNTVGFHFQRHPIEVAVGELVRVYLVNMTEFDLVNSFHLHATFFDVFRTGTRREASETTDTLILGQGERAILEFRFRWPGRYMFHAHISEFAELGWNGFFEAR